MHFFNPICAVELLYGAAQQRITCNIQEKAEKGSTEKGSKTPRKPPL